MQKKITLSWNGIMLTFDILHTEIVKKKYHCPIPYRISREKRQLRGDNRETSKMRQYTETNRYLSHQSQPQRSALPRLQMVSAFFLISRGHATLHLAVLTNQSVSPSVPSVTLLKTKQFFILPLPPNRPRLSHDCHTTVTRSRYIHIHTDAERKIEYRAFCIPNPLLSHSFFFLFSFFQGYGPGNALD